MKKPAAPPVIELQNDATPYRFGDPVSIAQRGLKPKKSRKSRQAYLKPERKFGRHQPIYQRIDGEWARYRCQRKKCKSVTFVVLDEEDLFVNVQCAAGHAGKVLKGFSMNKPDG